LTIHHRIPARPYNLPIRPVSQEAAASVRRHDPGAFNGHIARANGKSIIPRRSFPHPIPDIPAYNWLPLSTGHLGIGGVSK